MSNQHKHPTISFRISDAERKQIEARILASGMMKKVYFVRSCIYNRICVVGKKENIYPLVQTVEAAGITCEVSQTQSNGSDVTIQPLFGPALVPPNTASGKIIQMPQRKII